MPIYEYICEDCNTKYEKFIKNRLTEVALVCPMCGSPRAKKIFSIFGSSSATSGSSPKSGTGESCGSSA